MKYIKCKANRLNLVVVDKSSIFYEREFKLEGCSLAYNNHIVWVWENDLQDGMNVDQLIDNESYKELKLKGEL